jgi:uncharacterized membrane protein
MTIDPTLWPKAHGAMTHFPIALSIVSVFLDAIGFLRPNAPSSRGLHSAGFYTIQFAALGSLGAVFSGLVMTDLTILGKGALATHHAFVWPAFALLIELAVWRLVVGQTAPRRAFGFYLLLGGLLLAIISGAGATGGEMLQKG